MDLVKLIIIFISKIRSENDFIRKVYLVQNDIWGDGQPQIKTDKCYLYTAIIDFFDRSSCSSSSFANYNANFYGLKFTQCRYAPLFSKLTWDVYSYFKSPDIVEIFVRFKFIFTDIPIKGFFEYDRYNGKKNKSAQLINSIKTIKIKMVLI
ncbi:hypothetical protein NBO_11g0028 [Nosema bombycis CQ1]|uniref:Uncharacterized protein n=1 Tax=Nosema bombycis (strain CQ1 / CVCC 102059) TaxID=578461 RepID=R0KVP6_NOSB1|nr:hypothetical protein NBO_11g0028 [Nosema bombycis CQ1]|eukprot:EOB14956.1 hypothetical protein NBO_11g0028 [Nosema bombycis CQ1]